MPWIYNSDTELNEWVDDEAPAQSANDGNAGESEAAQYTQDSGSQQDTSADYTQSYNGGLLGLIGDGGTPSYTSKDSGSNAAEELVSTVSATTGLGDVVKQMVGGVDSVAKWLGADKTRQEWVLKAIGGIYAAQESRDKQARDQDNAKAILDHKAAIDQANRERYNKIMPGKFSHTNAPKTLRRTDGTQVWGGNGLISRG